MVCCCVHAPPHLQDGRTPLILGIIERAFSAVILLVDKMGALGLLGLGFDLSWFASPDMLFTFVNDKMNVLHFAAEKDMGDIIKTLLNADEAHVKAALAAKNTVLSRTTMFAVPMTVCACADKQAAEPARACSTMPPEHATCGCNQSYVCVLRL